MSTRAALWEIAALTICCYFLFCPSAEAYFDLTSGAYMIQATMAVVGSLWISMRYKWFNFVKTRKTTDVKTEPPASTDENQATE